MSKFIERFPAAAAREQFDLIVIGGGFQGVATALEAVRRGLRPLLIERNDFGGATSFNSLRIIHGGLRYLQQLDLRRFSESVRERSWFLHHFPDLVRPLPCLLPLYGRGLRRPWVLDSALKLNQLLSYAWDRDHPSAHRLPRAKMLNSDQTIEMFPQVRAERLQGGALWYDGVMLSPQRVLMTLLRWACSYGAMALNYVEATKLVCSQQGIAGVEAIDTESGDTLLFRAPYVLNCAGPWCRQVAQCLDTPEVVPLTPALAFNVVLNRRAAASCAVAVSPPRPGAATYFLVPLNHCVHAGTYHAPWCGEPGTVRSVAEHLESFLADLNAAVPALEVTPRDVVRVHSGLMPASSPGSRWPARRALVVDHGSLGGPHGLYSVAAVKLTTARAVAARTLQMAFPQNRPVIPYGRWRPPVANSHPCWMSALIPTPAANPIRAEIQKLARAEAVVHLDDFVLRRTAWQDTDNELESLAGVVGEALSWDTERRASEIQRMHRAVQEYRV